MLKGYSLVSYMFGFSAPPAISFFLVFVSLYSVISLRFPLHNLVLSCPHVSPATVGNLSRMIGEIQCWQNLQGNR